MRGALLRQIEPSEVFRHRKAAVDLDTLTRASAITEDVRLRGAEAVVHHGMALGDLQAGENWVRRPGEMRAALDSLPGEERKLLQRTAQRIRAFAEAQRNCLGDLSLEVPGGRAGHSVKPVQTAGCYAPGGRFALPSSVLMTAVTARVAGVETVWLASPRPATATLAAACIAGVDGMLGVGGAQAIAALAYGAGPVPACDVVAGPGNNWVTAAKQIVSSQVAIDMLAGPSELVVLADASANPRLVAADLLAQAEHDPLAVPMLVTLSADLAAAVEEELERQLAVLPSAAIARQALDNAFVTFVDNLDQAIALCDELAPEHLELCLESPQEAADRLRNYGALFIGSSSAEVFGDYGAGPNHVLPTGGTARTTSGLSVLTFLKVRTWLHIADPHAASPLAADAAALARIEGLEAHARAAEMRRPD